MPGFVRFRQALAALFLLGCSHLGAQSLQWEWLVPKTHDFGNIPRHQEATYTFEYRNTGSEPLYIDNVRTSCGCTAPDWEEKPIPPGETGKINIIYDAADIGYFIKSIKVYFHGRRKADKLYIEGDVVN
jgi:archaellum component FlaG (FlaF/FlaG flagellin family)